MTTETSPIQPTPRPRPSPLRRGVFAAGLVAGGIVLGAGTVALAHGDLPGGWHHGPRIGMIQHIVRGALENVGATTAQEDKIHDIIAATYTNLEQNRADRDAMRKQLFDLLKAPKIDAAAVEKLRAQKMGEMDTKSKTIEAALIDAMGQLTADQRTKLVEHVEARMSEHRWGGWGHGDRMGDRMDQRDGGAHDGPAHDGGADTSDHD